MLAGSFRPLSLRLGGGGGSPTTVAETIVPDREVVGCVGDVSADEE